MGKKKVTAATVEQIQSELNPDNVQADVKDDYEGPATHLGSTATLGGEAVVATVPLTEEQAIELKALQAELKDITSRAKEIKTKIRFLQTGEEAPVKVAKAAKSITFTFISNGEDINKMKGSNGKDLAYQAKVLLLMFIGDAPAGAEISYTKEQIIEKLEADYPCLGDKFNNFSWYKSQVFKPMGLMK
jgi:cell division protein FtsB